MTVGTRWPLMSCPEWDLSSAAELNVNSVVQSLVESGVLHHHVDLDGECWGASQLGRCLFSILPTERAS